MNNTYLLLIPMLICVIGAFLGTIIFKKNEKKNHIFIFVSMCLATIATWIMLFVVEGEKFIVIEFFKGLDFSLKLDGFGKIFSGMVSILWPLATLYAFSYMKHASKKRIYFMFYELTYAVVLGISFSANMETMYLFYECLTLCTLPLIIQPMTKQSKKAGRIYMYFSLAGSALAFVGLMILLHYTQGGTDFVRGGNLDILNCPSDIMLIGYLFSFLGFGVKSAIFPLHYWLPLAGVKSGVFALTRLTYYNYCAGLIKGSWVQTVVMCIAIFTILFGSIKALKETHFKRRLAYSTVSNLSYIVFGITLMSPMGLLAAVLHILFHSISKITLFFSCGIVMHEAEADYVYELDGLGKKMPITFICFFISALSLTGVPLFAGFVSKFYLLEAGINENALGLVGVVALIISALLTAVYSLSIVFRAFINEPNEHNLEKFNKAHDGDIKFSLPIIIFSILCVVFGIFSNGLIDLINSLVNL